MSWQLCVTLGITCGFASSLIVYAIDLQEKAWRWQTASVILPLMCLLSLTAVCPESPRFLLKRGKYAEAYESLCQLRETSLQAARDLIYINAQIQVESTLLPKKKKSEELRHASIPGQFTLQERVQKLSYWTRLTQIFINKRTWRAQQAASIVMIAQQLCGINAIIGYSSNILAFQGANFGPNVPYWLNFGIGLTNFIFTLPAYRYIDSKGRRFLLLAMYPLMTLTMLAAALSWMHPNVDARAGLVITFIFLFVMAYSVGQGPGKSIDNQALRIEQKADRASCVHICLRSISIGIPRDRLWILGCCQFGRFRYVIQSFACMEADNRRQAFSH